MFPRCGNRIFGLDRAFLCQSSSLEFLNDHKFDMQKWLQKGISYVNHEDEERIKAKLEMLDNDSPLTEKDHAYGFMVESLEKVRDFIQNSPAKSMSIETPSPYHSFRF